MATNEGQEPERMAEAERFLAYERRREAERERFAHCRRAADAGVNALAGYGLTVKEALKVCDDMKSDILERVTLSSGA